MADVKYIVTADTKTATTNIKKVDDSIDGMKRQASQSVNPLKGMFKQLATGLLSVIAVGTAVRSLTRFMKGAIDAAKEQELAEKGLTDALQSTGREVPVNATHFKDYAKELQGATKYGDEQILSAQALLIQLTDLDKKGLDAATKGSLGLATVFKTDLKAATNLVAKALAGNYGALSRYGISVTDLNTAEEKRASLLDQLGRLYERAKGEVDTFDGAVTQLKNTYGDLKEKIGDVIIKSDSLRGAIQLIQSTISNFIEGGYLDNWAAKFDLIIKNVPLFDALRRSLVLINADMALHVAEQKRATKAGEEWYNFLKNSDAELKIFGVDIYEAMRGLAGFNEEGKRSHTIIPKLAADFKDAAFEIEAFVNETQDGIIWLEMMKMEGEKTGGVLKTVFENLGLDYELTCGDIEAATKTTTEEISKFYEQSISGIADAWGDMFEDLLTEGSNFSDAIDVLFNSLVDNIRRALGDLVRDFIKENIFKTMASEASDAATSVGGSVGDVVNSVKSGISNLSGLATGLWTAAGAAVGTFLGGLLGGGAAGFDSHDSGNLKKLMENSTALYPILEENQKIQNNTSRLIDMWNHTKSSADSLRSIKNILRGAPSGQGGLNFYSGSQGGIVKYHPREQVTVTPNVNLNQQFQTLVIEKNDRYIIRVVQDNLNRLNIRVPTGALK